MMIRSKELSPYVTRCLLLASGLLAAGIAAMSFMAPNGFFAVYGIDIGADVNLTNELKASTGVLFVSGLLSISGAFRTDLFKPALEIAALVYLSYGLSRLASIAIDGIPDVGLVVAAIIEISVGGACLMRLVHLRTAKLQNKAIHR